MILGQIRVYHLSSILAAPSSVKEQKTLAVLGGTGAAIAGVGAAKGLLTGSRSPIVYSVGLNTH